MSDNIKLRPADSSDLEFLFRLRKLSSMEVIFSQFGSWNETAEKRVVERFLEDDCQVIEFEGQPAGMLLVDEKSDCLFLREIHLMPDFQGRGIGRHLIDDLKDQAVAVEKSLNLQVLKKNEAIAFYEKLGFSRSGETDTHYNLEYSN